MDILVLHGMGEEKNWVSSWEDMELMFPKYDPSNNYIVHNCIFSLPNCIKKYPFDAIILMSTFMDWVKRFPENHSWFRQYAFMKNTKAIKVVFSQDDYWLSEVRDAFCVGYNVDLLLPFCAPDKWEELYPMFIAAGGKIRQGYTCYLTDKMRKLQEYEIPWEDRKFDVVYRASGAPTYPNKFGYIKSKLGEFFENALTNQSQIKYDFSTAQDKFIRGNDWYKFISNSRAILGSNTGSSVNIRNMDVVLSLDEAKKTHPNAGINELEQLIIKNSDRNRNYDGLSPRNMEAAIIGTVQVLVRGNYGGILHPGEHYVPLNEDASNADEVIAILQNKDYCTALVRNCRQVFLDCADLNAHNIISEVLLHIFNHKRAPNPPYVKDMGSLKKRYQISLKLARIKYKLRKLFFLPGKLKNILSYKNNR